MKSTRKSPETVDLNMRNASKSDERVHSNMRNKSYNGMIYAYDFQARVSQMFAKDTEISSFVERNHGKFMELEKDPSEVLVYSFSVNSSVDVEMNSMSDNYNTIPLSPGPVLSETEPELEFSLSSPVSSLPPDINRPGPEEYFPSPISSNSSSPNGYGKLNQNFPLVNSYTNAMVMDEQLVHEHTSCAEEEVDLIYKKYSERMSWFDVLNHEKLRALSALRKHLSSPNSFEYEMEPTGMPVQYISLSRVARKRLVRSLENDLELVYVAQSCLSWEALHYQYKKVEALCCSTSKNGVFYGNVAARFQKFQILLERFVEDDSCGGKRHLNYVHTRFSQKNLLQVPEVTGYVESNEGLNGEMSKPMEVLKAIEQCIHAFWFYITRDCKKRKKFWWSQSCVEDPRDILRLHDLTKKLQMKGLWLKDIKGKRKCWLRRAIKPQQEEFMKMDFLFTLIDIELVSRILHMSIISTSHFKWCQQKLKNIEFKDGKILRTPTTPLFPS
ncbi:unnamed protein product [Withania somnifera]